jgi:alkanesulfonate monooxygenase SsuD/methylene tetrahydromethanopterin reductase-like flavin-dependent oxidoreductase (luciferase family)
VVWAAEAYGSDSPTILAWLAAQTSTIHVGSAIMQIPARTPAMTAMTAASLDVLTGGRFRLGVGVSGPQVSEGWHGVGSTSRSVVPGNTSRSSLQRCRGRR